MSKMLQKLLAVGLALAFLLSMPGVSAIVEAASSAAKPTIDTKSPVSLGSFGVTDDGKSYVFGIDWLNTKMSEKFGKPIDVSKNGWHLVESRGASYFDTKILEEQQGEQTVFTGIEITGKRYSYGRSMVVYYNYWPTDEDGNWHDDDHYVCSFSIAVVTGYENAGDGSIFGTNHVPAGEDGDYYYGTAYAGYERVYVNKVNSSDYTPIITTVLVKMDGSEKDWLPDNKKHVDDWTASSEHNFEVAYCADSETLTNDSFATYKIAHLKDLDTKFDVETQNKLQAIIEHSYPFISEEEMLKNLEEAGIHLDVYGEYASELMMTATQIAIWSITNPDEWSANCNLGSIKTKGFAIPILKDDFTVENIILTAEDCVNNTTQEINSPGTVAKDHGYSYGLSYFWNEYKAIINYLLNTCESSIADPILNAEWDCDDHGNVTVKGTVTGNEENDTLTLTIPGEESVTIDINEDGTFEYTFKARGEAERERRWKEGAWGDSGRKGAGRWTGAPEVPNYELRITMDKTPDGPE